MGSLSLAVEGVNGKHRTGREAEGTHGAPKGQNQKTRALRNFLTATHYAENILRPFAVACFLLPPRPSQEEAHEPSRASQCAPCDVPCEHTEILRA